MKTICLSLFLSIIICSCISAQNAVNYSRIVTRQGLYYYVNSQTPFTGSVFANYENGQKKIEGLFLKGQKNGKWIEWFNNGQKEFEGMYKKGEYNGRIKKWQQDGITQEDCGYINGVLHGKCILNYYNGNTKFDGWYKYGQLDSLVSEYSDDGTLRKQAVYKNGVLNGSYWEYPFTGRGNRVRCTYRDGELNGNFVEYHYTGKPAIEGVYVMGRKEGLFTHSYPDGRLKRTVSYINGLKEGQSIFMGDKETYAPDKSMLAMMFYVNDRLDGKYIAWSDKGNSDPRIADDAGQRIIEPPGGSYEKMEGCFDNGMAVGIFKYWILSYGDVIPTNTYHRQVWQNGQLIDNGQTEGYTVEFKPDGTPKEMMDPTKYGDRFTRKYNSPCDEVTNSLIENKSTSGSINTLTDIDGNIYNTIKIGTQVWMVENLKTTKFNDGTSIPNINDSTAWSNLTTPGYCFYDNDAANKNTYGALYNWYTVNTGKLAPTGWHVPTVFEWINLENHLIANGYNYDSTITENKIAKSMAATTLWNSHTNTGAIGNDISKNNTSGFAALPGGYRGYGGELSGIGYWGYWWSSTEYSTTDAWYGGGVCCNDSGLDRGIFTKSFGFSVRCVRDY